MSLQILTRAVKIRKKTCIQLYCFAYLSRKRRRMVDGNGEKKRRRVGGISLNNKASSVLDVDEYSSRIYKPRSSKTEAKYYELLDIISKFYPDESGVFFYCL